MMDVPVSQVTAFSFEDMLYQQRLEFLRDFVEAGFAVDDVFQVDRKGEEGADNQGEATIMV